MDVVDTGPFFADLHLTLSVDAQESCHPGGEKVVEILLQISDGCKPRDPGLAPSILGYVGVSHHTMHWYSSPADTVT
jgi:hypothetical protein